MYNVLRSERGRDEPRSRDLVPRLEPFGAETVYVLVKALRGQFDATTFCAGFEESQVLLLACGGDVIAFTTIVMHVRDRAHELFEI